MINKYNISEILMLKLNDSVSNGKEISGRCPHPDHEDNHKSFSFNIEKLRGYCHGCGRSFSIKYLLDILQINTSNFLNFNNENNENEFDFSNDNSDEDVEVISMDLELMKLSIMSTIENRDKKEEIKPVLNYDYEVYKNNHDDDSIKYLKSRGFKDYERLINEFHVGYDINKTYKSKKDGNTYRSPSITLPCITKGVCNYIQRRYTGRNPLVPRYLNMYGVNRDKVLYGYDFCDNSDMIIVCEGPFNALTWLYLGFNAVAILGTTISNHQLKLLQGKTKICNFDIDIAGQRCYNKIRELDNNIIYNFCLDEDANSYISSNRSQELIDKLEDMFV
jgi:DNA primase